MATGPVLVVDFGAQYAQLIARRVREANVYSELVPHSMPVDEMLAKDPKAIILSGGVPVLGICYGFQVMAYELGGKVDKAALGEYGKTATVIDKAEGLLDGSPADQSVWMSHGVAVEAAPEGFEVLAHTEGAPVAAMQDPALPRASCTVCSGIRRSSTRRWGRSSSRPSCMSAPVLARIGTPPASSRTRWPRSVPRWATPR